MKTGRMKRKPALFFVGFLIVFAVLVFMYLFSSGCIAEKKECFADSDCVPASCCHASLCTAKTNAPDCSDVFCTQECVPETMDCGQGKCVCIGGRCSINPA